jgi:hypothetical protein
VLPACAWCAGGRVVVRPRWVWRCLPCFRVPFVLLFGCFLSLAFVCGLCYTVVACGGCPRSLWGVCCGGFALVRSLCSWGWGWGGGSPALWRPRVVLGWRRRRVRACRSARAPGALVGSWVCVVAARVGRRAWLFVLCVGALMRVSPLALRAVGALSGPALARLVGVPALPVARAAVGAGVSWVGLRFGPRCGLVVVRCSSLAGARALAGLLVGALGPFVRARGGSGGARVVGRSRGRGWSVVVRLVRGGP